MNENHIEFQGQGVAANPRSRAVIEQVLPQIDGGRFPIKRIVGDWVSVTADIFADGHDLLSARLCYRHAAEAPGSQNEVVMVEAGNDRWSGEFQVTALGRYEYTIVAWVDGFRSWQRDLQKKMEAGSEAPTDLLAGVELIEAASQRATGRDGHRLSLLGKALRQISDADISSGPAMGLQSSLAEVLGEELDDLMSKYAERRFATTYDPWLGIVVDREAARFSAWYEMFPRSASPEPGRHGTLKDCEARLPEIAEMGFDVLYLPPIHPIGITQRKGKNNSAVVEPGDVGSPWAIGSREGGHKAIHPDLGSIADFDRLVSKCRDFGIEIALDLAYQCSPDHPYVKEHLEWFRRRPDGSVQYAENPPKKYQDIFPFDFQICEWQGLWEELKSIVFFWMEHGVRIFRVDNPHTKPFVFWEWFINDIKAAHPEVLFLSEAFTRPKVMYRLAKLGFSQSYTYFAWRNTKWELTEYFTELYTTVVSEFFRPHLWPNTPDILTEYLQLGGRPAFIVRLVLAATLGANFGIYGPAFELCENRPLIPGKEEYLDAEKYQVRYWNTSAPESLRELIARVNQARRQNPALQSDRTLRFHPVDNEQLIAYSKTDGDHSNIVLVVVNLDPKQKQSGWVEVPLDALRLDPQQPYQVHDLLTGSRYVWSGSRNYVELDPHGVPAHIFRVGRYLRTEQGNEFPEGSLYGRVKTLPFRFRSPRS